MKSKTDNQLTYRREDDQAYILSDVAEAPHRVPKNRDIPESFIQSQAGPLAPAFRLLGMAVLGLAPAGLGTLILAPLALLWTLYIFFTRRLEKADRIRTAIVVGIAIVLLGFAIPLSLLFLAALS